MLDLHALIRVMPKAQHKLQAMFIDFQQYKNTWIVGGLSTMLQELDFMCSPVDKWEDKPDELVD